MRRTQIYLDDELDRDLRAVAAADGRSVTDIVREALRSYLAERSGRDPIDPIAAMIGAIDGLPPDAAAQHDPDLYLTTRKSRSG